MKRGEVWWVEFDPSVGSEIRKTRPAVVVSNNVANRNLERVVVTPLTSRAGRQYPGEALVAIGKNQSKVMADQIMAADKRRLKKSAWFLVQGRHVSSRGRHSNSFGNAQGTSD